MTLASQHRLSRAGIVIGVLLCVAGILEMTLVLPSLVRQLGGMPEEELQDPTRLGHVVGEMLIVAVVRFWPLPLGLLALLPSLVWRHRLCRRMESVSQPR
jgi:hypothetical protein